MKKRTELKNGFYYFKAKSKLTDRELYYLCDRTGFVLKCNAKLEPLINYAENNEIIEGKIYERR